MDANDIDWSKAYRLLKERAKNDIDDFKIVYKNESKLHKTIRTLTFFGRDYGERTTALYPTVAFPSYDYVMKDERRAFSILAHEMQHLYDAQNDKLFYVKYLSPQALGLLSVFALLAFVHLAFLGFLLFAIFFAPWSSPYRLEAEVRAWTAQLCIMRILEQGPGLYIHNLIKKCRKWDYYRMSKIPYAELNQLFWDIYDDCHTTELYAELYGILQSCKKE